MEAAHHPWPALGDLVVREGLVGEEDLEAALAEQRGSGVRLGEILVERGQVTRTQVARLLAAQQTYKPSNEELTALGRTSPRGVELARGRGRTTCGGTGFRGRVGLFEVLPLTEEIRALASDHASTADIQSAAVAAGMRTLREDGIRLCLEGVTTADEVRRVAGDWNA